MVAAFVVYYCMYAFRKPFGAATWEGAFFATSIQVKNSARRFTSAWLRAREAHRHTYLFRSEVRTDCVSCCLAVFCSRGSPCSRCPYAGDYKFVAMFFNGLSLGMVWGLVMRPLEGRAMTEMLLAGLCVSFIIASGDVKSTGKWLMESDFFLKQFGGNEAWMPFATAAIYLPFFVIGAVMLFVMPQPTQVDRALRNERKSMQDDDRQSFIKHHIVLLVPLAISYFLLTAYRDFRDTFQAEIFTSLGIVEASAFSTTERYVAFGVVAVLSIFIFIRDSRTALVVCHLVMASGLVFCGVSTWLMTHGMLSGYRWMVLAGLGAYICYIAFHCIVFERHGRLYESAG